MHKRSRTRRIDDVCFVVEGTATHLHGGISTWIRRLCSGANLKRATIVEIRPGTRAGERTGDSSEGHARVRLQAPAHVDATTVDNWVRAVTPLIPRARIYHAASIGLASELALAQRNQGAAVVVTEHASAREEYAQGATHSEAGAPYAREADHATVDRLLANFEAHSYARADAVTSLYAGRQAAQIARGLHRDRSHVIANGVELPTRERRPPRTVPVFGQVGRINPIKGSMQFIDVMEELFAHGYRRRGLSIGPFDCCDDFRDAYLDRCRSSNALSWVGALPIARWTEKIDVLVVTSKSEAQPFVVLEAMARGIPVVALKVGNCEEMLTCPRSGPPAGLIAGDVSELVRQCVRLARDARLRDELGLAGMTRARTHYGVRDMVEQYTMMYQAALGRATARWGGACNAGRDTPRLRTSRVR